MTVVPLNVYKACLEKKQDEKKDEKQEVKTEDKTEDKTPDPIVYEIGCELIGKLNWYQKVIANTRQIYNQCIDIQTNPNMLKDVSNSELTKSI